MHEFRQFAKGITQAGNLAQVAVLVAIFAAVMIAFAERMAKNSQQLTWAPWMQKKNRNYISAIPVCIRGYCRSVCSRGAVSLLDQYLKPMFRFTIQDVPRLCLHPQFPRAIAIWSSLVFAGLNGFGTTEVQRLAANVGVVIPSGWFWLGVLPPLFVAFAFLVVPSKWIIPPFNTPVWGVAYFTLLFSIVASGPSLYVLYRLERASQVHAAKAIEGDSPMFRFTIRDVLWLTVNFHGKP